MVALEKTVPRAKAVCQPLPDAQEMGRRFFGEDWAMLHPCDRGTDDPYTVAFESDPPFEGTIGQYWMDLNPEQGRAYIHRPSGLAEFSKQDLLAGRSRSNQAGVYTRDEAEAMARTALEDVLGIDTRLLLLHQEYADDEGREKSSRYDFYYVYVHEGMLLTTADQTPISVIVTNAGVADINGRALTVGE